MTAVLILIASERLSHSPKSHSSHIQASFKRLPKTQQGIFSQQVSNYWFGSIYHLLLTVLQKDEDLAEDSSSFGGKLPVFSLRSPEWSGRYALASEMLCTTFDKSTNTLGNFLSKSVDWKIVFERF